MKLPDIDRWKRIDFELSRMLDKPEAERRASLAELDVEPSLRAVLERLLDGAHDDWSCLSHYREQCGREMASYSLTPETIGEWRVERLIGEGGMARVFVAHRRLGEASQTAALKLLRRELVGHDARERFDQERSILANLTHGCIARLYDAGVDKGIPWLAMEMTTGAPIDTYCDANGLTIRERIRLLLPVLDAVAHAHRHLVVHRDLKPENILITAQGKAKLLDFGIAKIIEAGGESSQTLSTRTGRRVFTLGYASPEQITGQTITTATDVYQLGVILYQLIAGRRPFWKLEANPLALQQAIAHDCPKTPTQCMAAFDPDERAAWAHAHSSKRFMRYERDLDRIVIKALASEPEQRYRTVSEMMNDLQNWLVGRPLTVDRSRFAHSLRWLRRHRWAVATSAVLLATLLFGLSAVVIFKLQTKQAQATTSAAERLINNVLELATPGASGEVHIPPVKLLELAADNIHTELATAPKLRASLLEDTARYFSQHGHYARAADLYRQALEGLARTEAQYRSLHAKLGRVNMYLARYPEAIRNFENLRAAVMAEFPNEDHHGLSDALRGLGQVAQNQGHYETAEAFLLDALAMRSRLYQADNYFVAVSLRDLGFLYLDWRRYARAMDYFERAMATDLKQAPLSRWDLALTMDGLGLAFLRFDERQSPAIAASMFQGALDLRHNSYFGQHWLEALGDIRLVHAESHLETDNTAFLRLEDGLQRIQALGDHPVHAAAQVMAASTAITLGDEKRASQWLAQALAQYERLQMLEHPALAEVYSQHTALARLSGQCTKSVQLRATLRRLTSQHFPEVDPETMDKCTASHPRQ